MKRTIERLAKRTFRQFGLEVTRRAKSPTKTFLGLTTRPIRTIVDIGANEGQFARLARSAFPDAVIHCIEPQPGPYRVLQKYARSQAPASIRTHQLAVGAESSKTKLRVHVNSTVSSSLLQSTDEALVRYPEQRGQTELEVEVKSLDEIVSAVIGPIHGEVLIKMDVQGYEVNVIRGGALTLTQAVACITEVIVDPLYIGQPTFEDLADELRGLGYRYAGNLAQTYDSDGHVMFFDALFLRDKCFLPSDRTDARTRRG